jgi:hypothetical protein
MRRGLEVDVLQCPNCGGRMRFVAAIMLTFPLIHGVLLAANRPAPCALPAP